MHVGLVMECDYREGRTQEEAFAEAMSIAEIAETQGLDGVWLAERHFAMHRRPTDPMGAGIPSIASVGVKSNSFSVLPVKGLTVA